MPQNLVWLKGIVVALGLAILVCLGVIGVTLYARASRGGPISTELVLPADADILETHIEGTRLLVRLRRGGGEEIRLFDLQSGAPGGLIRLKREAADAMAHAPAD